MNSCLECMPCLGRNAVDAAVRATGDAGLRKKIVTEAFRMLAECSLDMPPPYYAGKIFDLAGKYADISGLYAAEKEKSNQLAENLLTKLPDITEYDPASFESRLRLAVAGNILDFGVFQDLDLSAAMEHIRKSFSLPLDMEAVARIEERIRSAEKIFYLLDNCGEAVFDRIFMEPFRHKVVLGVRGREIFNDVAMSDLAGCKLENFAVRAVSNGSGIPGTVTELCSKEFMDEFNSADLIIAKGQGNFETLNDSTAPIAFMFMAKCPVVAGMLDVTLKSIQIRTLNF